MCLLPSVVVIAPRDVSGNIPIAELLEPLFPFVEEFWPESESVEEMFPFRSPSPSPMPKDVPRITIKAPR